MWKESDNVAKRNGEKIKAMEAMKSKATDEVAAGVGPKSEIKANIAILVK